MQPSLKNLLIIFSILLLATVAAKADFGEVDLIIRESVENHFKEYDQDVKMNTLQIDHDSSEQIGQVSILKIETLVKAYNEDLSSFAWYACTTKIQISSTHHLTDLGSDCSLDVE